MTTGGACLDAFAALGASRICVVTPYRAAVNDRLVSYLQGAGIETLAIAATASAGPPPAVTGEELLDAVRQAWRDDADALLIACTGLHALDLIAPLEAELGRPVVTSNQATFRTLLRAAGVDARIPGFGRLLDPMTTPA